MARFTAKDARTLMARTGVRTVADRKCVVCGAPLPKERQKYCSKKCSDKWWSKGAFPRSKSDDVKGYKVNKCQYCGLRADSSDNKRTATDSRQVRWFWCKCTPNERQLFDVAEMEVGDGD